MGTREANSTNDVPVRPLPSEGPALVLVGFDEPDILDQLTQAELDRLAAESAATLDIRTGVLWTEVTDGIAFLHSVLDAVPDQRERVRFGFAPLGSTSDELVRRAVVAPDLEEMARRLEAADLHRNPPTFEVRFQPIIKLDDQTVVGFESLIRAEADGRNIDADELIQRASNGRWLTDLDGLGRSLALRGVGPWLGEGLLFLNVMAPGGEFDLEAVAATVDEAVEAGLEPDQLVLEAVERNRYRSIDDAAAQIDEIRDMGVRIAVDDVGDGFASLRVVAAFRPDIVKIAGELTKGLPSSESEAVISAIVHMAHDAGAWVVAENVEEAEQAERARKLGVDWAQGHFFGPPINRDGDIGDGAAEIRTADRREIEA